MDNSPSIREILQETDDSELCNRVDCCIYRYFDNHCDVRMMSQSTRVVHMVMCAMGIIQNGGFQYLFEGSFLGDPQYRRLFACMKATGCAPAIQAFEQALSLFPNSQPPADRGDRLKIYLKKNDRWPTDHDDLFLSATEDLVRHLARFIREHTEEFHYLDEPRKTPVHQSRKKPPKPSSKKKDRPTLAALPHWARVSFVAHCTSLLDPLIDEIWPGLPKKYRNAPAQAVKLINWSAQNGRPHDDLNTAQSHCTMLAGAAYMGKESRLENVPANLLESGKVANIAKAAEYSARAAQTKDEESLNHAMTAFSYAISAAENARKKSIIQRLYHWATGKSSSKALIERFHADFWALEYIAQESGWTDQSPMPDDLWTILDES